MTDNIYQPFKTTVKTARDVAKEVKLFALAVPADFAWQSGQFVMVSLPGAGEIPISITSMPGAGKDLELCVRTVGRVSASINALAPGDDVWVRGPYGRPFPLDGARDTLFICGGIGLVPLRPLINQTMHARAQADGANTITVMYGARTPAELLFLDEIEQWREQGATIVMTVDTCRIDDWKGCTGLVTEHFDKTNIDYRNSTAYVCGPPVMIQAAMRDLSLMGMPADRIVTTLEAHMKCGVGKCGHCYCGGKLICEEGPVFTLEEIRSHRLKAGIDSLA